MNPIPLLQPPLETSRSFHPSASPIAQSDKSQNPSLHDKIQNQLPSIHQLGLLNIGSVSPHSDKNPLHSRASHSEKKRLPTRISHQPEKRFQVDNPSPSEQIWSLSVDASACPLCMPSDLQGFIMHALFCKEHTERAAKAKFIEIEKKPLPGVACERHVFKRKKIMNDAA